MTENEVKAIVREIIMNYAKNGEEKYCEALDTAVKALEEVQQYRALGTPEDLKTMKENGAFTGVELAEIACSQRMLNEYIAIGTVEECRRWKQKDRNTAKKVEFISRGSFGRMGRCPCCAALLNEGTEYCSCGQKVKWRR